MTIRLPQLAMLTGIKRHTLNARAKNILSANEIERNRANQITLNPSQINKILQNDIYKSKCRIIYIGNLKGGVGKTALSYILCETLSNLGFKTCAIDLDVQANLTSQYLKPNSEKKVFLDLIEKLSTLEETITNLRPYLDIIPSSLKNSLIEKCLTMQQPKHYLTWLNDLCLNNLREIYDFIVVDTPPHLTTLNSVFCLCLEQQDTLLIPVSPDEFSLLGVNMFLDDVFEIRKSYRVIEQVNIKIVMNRFFQTQRSNLEALIKMNQQYGELFSNVILKDYSKIREIIENKSGIMNIKSGKEIYTFIANLLKELNIIKGQKNDIES